ncbi:hypothetical protein BpHYR1_046445 [Brachionus plicatilis]|uniref:Uncharacterized protein n=1 Tax=Brachionus plicatilis TaxID=10195 RepID=A0A3M7RHM9_BRAPC|nr:hypothetical protein BpHYR1_046445 [Brachionus plicatilis]
MSDKFLYVYDTNKALLELSLCRNKNNFAFKRIKQQAAIVIGSTSIFNKTKKAKNKTEKNLKQIKMSQIFDFNLRFNKTTKKLKFFKLSYNSISLKLENKNNFNLIPFLNFLIDKCSIFL